MQRAVQKLSRKEIDELTTFVNQFGAKGLAWFKVDENGLTSQIAKFFNAELQSEIIERFSAVPGDLLLFVADKESVVSQATVTTATQHCQTKRPH